MTAIFWSLYLYCLLERIAELFISRRNQQRMRAQGFSEKESAAGMRFMVVVHVGWYVTMAGEALWYPYPLPSVVEQLALIAFLAAQLLRFWALRTLGTYWNISVVTTDRETPQFVSDGPYRYIRHPNYLVVITEILTLPLIGGSLVTALIFSTLNAIVLYRRIRLEEVFLLRIPGYGEVMGGKGRFLPRFSSRTRS